MKTAVRSILILLPLLALGLGGAYLYRQWTGPGVNVAAAMPLRIDAHCDPSRALCLATAEDFELRFGLGPDLRPLRMFSRRVELVGPEVDGILVDFLMRDMDMGINRFRLTAVGPGRWTGEGIIPVCWVGRRDWIARLTIETDAGHYRADFPVEIATIAAESSG